MVRGSSSAPFDTACRFFFDGLLQVNRAASAATSWPRSRLAARSARDAGGTGAQTAALRPRPKAIMSTITQSGAPRLPWYRQLWTQVLVAMGIGVVLGWLDPELGAAMQPLGDGFIKLIRMLI